MSILYFDIKCIVSSTANPSAITPTRHEPMFKGIFKIPISPKLNIIGKEFVTREIKCDTLFERINKLIEAGDGYVILQGGTGTLLELAAVWELSNKGLMNHKPVACHSSMWEEIVSVMNKQMKLEGRDDNIVRAFNTVEEIVSYLVTNTQ